MMRHAAGIAFICLAAVGPPAAAQGVPPRSVVRTGTLGNTPLRESSGVAVSRHHPGVLWTHNDSSDDPNIYAITQRGELLASYRVTGAHAIDWEDLALGSCPVRWAGRTCLYIADTGDNQERRPRTVLYAVPEPDPSSGSEPRATETALELRVGFTDAAHDIEAIAIDGAGTLHLVTKGRSGRVLRYEVESGAWQQPSVVLPPADTLPIRPNQLVGRWVTGAAMSPDGRQAAVRTYSEIYFFLTGRDRWQLDGPPCRVAGLEPQGEAVAFLDADKLILTSEKGLLSEGVIHLVRCR